MATLELITTEQAQQRLAGYWEDAAGCANATTPDPPQDVLDHYDRQGGLSLRTIQRACKDGRLRAHKLGRDFLIEESSLLEWFAKLNAERQGQESSSPEPEQLIKLPAPLNQRVVRGESDG